MSPFWQWFWAIIGGVAFLMAAPTFLQLIFGQPDIGFTFSEDDTGEGRKIKMHLMNPPINNPILRKIRVTRLAAQDIYITLDIFDSKGKEVSQFLPSISLSPYEKSGRVSLPSSTMMTNTTIAEWDRSTNSAILMDNRHTVLTEDVYNIRVGIGIDGRTKLFRLPAILIVGKTEEDLIWYKQLKEKFYK